VLLVWDFTPSYTELVPIFLSIWLKVSNFVVPNLYIKNNC
jgi:hypothetical protein